MQKTKKKRYKCEKNMKFSKMQKIKGFGAYSKMSRENKMSQSRSSIIPSVKNGIDPSVHNMQLGLQF